MRIPLYITEYDDGSSRRSKRASHLGLKVDWAARLPAFWRGLTIGPLWVDVNRDEGTGAERWMGYDEEEQPCFCRYRFQVPIGFIDSGVESHYSEDLAAWRLRDGRWLIHRVINSLGEGKAAYAFYAFSERMPR